MELKEQTTLNKLTTIANKYALRGEWSWKNTGGTGYLQGIISILIGGHENNAQKFDECAKEIEQLLVNNSLNSEWGWKDLSKPPHDLKIDLWALVDKQEMSDYVDSFFKK